MGIFKKKGKQKITAPEMPKMDTVPEKTPAPVKKDKKEVEHYILAQCEVIMETTKELSTSKHEYEVVSSYLGDIELLENLPQEQQAEIKDAAQNVTKINRVREEYQNTDKTISDAQYAQLQQMENEIPDEIRRLRSNEAYQSTVRRDMQYLEGEKSELSIRYQDIMEQQKLIQKMLYFLVGISVMSVALILIVQIGLSFDCEMAWMLLVFLVAIATFGLFMKRQNNSLEKRQIEVNMNHAIELLNTTKIKYVNMTNAVDYACEKYHVKNSYELNYMWEQYMEAVKERKKYMQTSEDLEYYNVKLLKILHKYHMYDERIWIGQAAALVNEKEMVEVKHDLFSRRQKLRENLDYNMKIIHKAQREVDFLSAKMKHCPDHVKEIVTAVDKLCETL